MIQSPVSGYWRVKSEPKINLKLFTEGDKGHLNCKDERPHASSDKEPSTWSPKSIRFLGVYVCVCLYDRVCMPVICMNYECSGSRKQKSIVQSRSSLGSCSLLQPARNVSHTAVWGLQIYRCMSSNLCVF
uniref:(northern house mosquito) hypothetical protein n=1 Tax=Culex pipiens TaxID=7175 RepID=A0A8D8AGM2_CULPI